MFRCIKAERSVLPMILSSNAHIRQFHVTSKVYVRKILRKNISNSVESENLKNDSYINFLGIESDIGVITLGPPRNVLPQSITKTDAREKFHRASFGVVRYDSDNKIKFHGQYQNNTDFVFLRRSTTDVAVSVDTSKLPNRPLNYSKTPCNEKENDKCRDPYPLEKTEQNESYIDKYYFNDISQRDNNDCNEDIHSSAELNFIDKNYFKALTTSEIKSPENYVSERDDINYSDIQTPSDLNFLDKNNFETIKISEKERNETIVEIEHSNTDAVSHSPMQELNYFDENYLKKNVSETQISPNAQFSGDVLVKPEVNSDCRKNKISEINSIENFDTNLESDIIKDQKITTESSQMLIERADYNNHVVDFSSDINNKREILIDSNMKINHYEKISNKVSDEKLEQILTDDFQNAYFSPGIEKAGLLPKQNRQKLDSNILSDNQTVKSVLHENKFKHSSPVETEGMSTAHDFVTKLRKEQEIPQQNVIKEKASESDEKFDSKGFRILKNQVDDLTHFTRDEILNILKQNVVYSDDDLLILNKPYGLVMHDSQTASYPCLSTFLNDLAKDLNKKDTDPKLFTVHRLDKETTGCLLLARNEKMAQYLKSLFAQRKIIKRYWIVTSRVPDPPEGIIDIPICEGSINNKKRMVLHAKLPKDIGYRNHSRQGKEAITSYSVISESGNAALVEAFPKTGLKHQIRVHFGFGLSCPILGDHKYSHIDKLAPQKLPSDILQRLKVRQSKVRYIPMHIHAKSVTIPQYFEDRDLFVNIPLPKHMVTNLKRLKFRKK